MVISSGPSAFHSAAPVVIRRPARLSLCTMLVSISALLYFSISAWAFLLLSSNSGQPGGSTCFFMSTKPRPML